MISTIENKKCVIYCRVSSIKQSTEGHGLESQEERCNRKAQSLGLEVLEVFKESITGSTMVREQFQSMLKLCKKNPGLTIIIDDISRYSRDTVQGLDTMKQIEAMKCRIICLNQIIDTTTPEGWFMLTIAISTGQLMRQQNARQVSQKMLSRVQQGFWCFNCPVGYDRGQMPQKNAQSTVIKELLESFATNNESIADFHRKLKSQGIKVAKIDGAKNILTNPLYAGYLIKEDWGVSLIQAQHEPIISFEIHQRILDKLKTRVRPELYNTTNDQIFYHRGFLTCAKCNKNLSYVLKSNGKGYKAPYYFCGTRLCPDRSNNIRLDVIEAMILDKLKDLTTKPEFFELLQKMLMDMVDDHQINKYKEIDKLNSRLRDNQSQIKKLVAKTIETDSKILIKNYEEMIDNLDIENRNLASQIAQITTPKEDIGPKIEYILGLYQNLYRTYQEVEPDHKKVLLHLILDEKIIVDLKSKYCTLVFSSLIALMHKKNALSVSGGDRGIRTLVQLAN